MVKLNCETPSRIKLQDLVPFQGDLKKRSEKEIDQLITSLSTEGLMAPFFIWKKDEKNYILDGHGRMSALVKMSMTDPSILGQEFPMLEVEAETEDDARKALLQISSQYGHITKKGYAQFTATIPTYDKACIKGYGIVTRHRKPKTVNPSAYSLLKLKVPTEHEQQIREILSKLTFVEVLS